MMPPELLHTSGSGLIMYMFKALALIVSDACSNILDTLHQRISVDAQRQSETDFPRGSVCNGIIDGIKCQSTERRGNLFRLLYTSCTTGGKAALTAVWQTLGITDARFRSFIMLYRSMEEWMHGANTKVKVRSSRPLIARVLRLLEQYFPQVDGHGWSIPKYHGMSTIVSYIQLYGSGISFYGGPGELHNKYFVKAPGANTQRRV